MMTGTSQYPASRGSTGAATYTGPRSKASQHVTASGQMRQCHHARLAGAYASVGPVWMAWSSQMFRSRSFQPANQQLWLWKHCLGLCRIPLQIQTWLLGLFLWHGSGIQKLKSGKLCMWNATASGCVAPLYTEATRTVGTSAQKPSEPQPRKSSMVLWLEPTCLLARTRAWRRGAVEHLAFWGQRGVESI